LLHACYLLLLHACCLLLLHAHCLLLPHNAHRLRLLYSYLPQVATAWRAASIALMVCFLFCTCLYVFATTLSATTSSRHKTTPRTPHDTFSPHHTL
jgi:hypothetical protein